MTSEKVVIIGSGMAGLTAAIYAARGNLQPLVIEGDEPGGQLTLTSVIENYPGFVDGIGGLELVTAMHQQAERFGARFRFGRVTELSVDHRPYRLEIEGEDAIEAHAVIVASGARARFLGIPNEREYVGRGVSTCATCDAAFFRGRTVVVVGGGDSALEEALYLTKFAHEVHVIHRRAELRASKIMQERALSHGNLKFIWNTTVEEVLVDGNRLTGVRLNHIDTGRSEDFTCDGLFIAIGHIPNTEFCRNVLPLDDLGYIKANGVMTNLEGVFVAGDVADKEYQQAITAAGEGCKAAMEAEYYLEE